MSVSPPAPGYSPVPAKDSFAVLGVFGGSPERARSVSVFGSPVFFVPWVRLG